MSLALSSKIRSSQATVHSWAAAHPTVIPLGIISVFALALRLFSISSRGLWADESFRVLAARQATLFDTLHAAWAQPPSAPLYWLALHVWINLFGHSDTVVRLLSVPASVGTLAFAYNLGKMAGGKLTGLLAALLLAVAPYAVETGQEATMYAWSAFFATGMIWAAFSWLKSGRGAWIYVAFATLLLYTHYMGTLLLLETAIVGAIWIARTKSGGTTVHLSAWIKAQLLVVLLWLPWAVAMGVRLLERAEEFSHLKHPAGLAELYGAVANMTLGASAAVTWPTQQLLFGLLAGGCLVVLALLLRRKHEQRIVIWSLTAIAAAFVLTVVGLSAMTGAWIVQPRFFSMLVPAMAVVMAAGLPVRRGVTPLVVVTVLLLGVWLLVQINGVRAFYENPVHGRDGVRETAAWLNTERRPEDIVVANQALLLWPLMQYYDGVMYGLPQDEDVWDGYGLWPPPEQLDLAPSQWEALQQRGAGAKRVWLVYLPVMDLKGTLMRLMNEHYNLVEKRVYGFAEVYLFAKK